MTLKYAVEQLIHFTCPCGYHWTHSGPLPDWLIVCPKCNAVAFELEQVTDRPLIEAFSDEELANELERRQKAKFISAYDKIHSIWLDRSKRKLAGGGLNGALGSLVRAGNLNGMSFSEFLTILNSDKPDRLMSIRGIGKGSIEVLREYFKTSAMPQRGVK